MAFRFMGLTGIIPADAGSTLNGFPLYGTDRDHPRGCGEHRGYKYLKLSTLGSSPRMRGAPASRMAGREIRGIIPADAGSTIFNFDGQFPTEDHPRGCGEHQFMLMPSTCNLGSSPRMRGAHLEILAISTI